jgi:hypothetical protein
MPKAERPERFAKKLDDIRGRLLGDELNVEELQRMQLQMDLLERAMADDLDFHHHDTNEHHDHVTFSEEVAEQPAVRPRRATRRA